MKFNVEKLKKMSRPMTEDEKRDIEFRRENREWLAISERLALKLRHILKTEGISQTSDTLQELVDESSNRVIATGSSFSRIVDHMHQLTERNDALFKGVTDLTKNVNSIQQNSERIHQSSENLAGM